MPPLDDLDRLRHMDEAIGEAIGYTVGRSRADLDDDRQLQHSLVRLIGIVGEAASRLSVDARRRAPEVEWPKIVAMRNHLVHQYFSVDLDIVWRTATADLADLVPPLQRLIREIEESPA